MASPSGSNSHELYYIFAVSRQPCTSWSMTKRLRGGLLRARDNKPPRQVARRRAPNARTRREPASRLSYQARPSLEGGTTAEGTPTGANGQRPSTLPSVHGRFEPWPGEPAARPLCRRTEEQLNPERARWGRFGRAWRDSTLMQLANLELLQPHPRN